MPRRATGNAREANVCEALDTLGYYVIQLKGSGARGARMRRRQHSVIGDILAIHERSWPWLQIEVGAHSATSAFKALRAHPMPGFTPIFVSYVYRLTKGKERSKRAVRRVYVSEKEWYSGFGDALIAIQANR